MLIKAFQMQGEWNNGHAPALQAQGIFKKIHVWGSHCRAGLVSRHGEGPDHLLQVLSSVLKLFWSETSRNNWGSKQKALQLAIKPKLKQHKIALSEVVAQSSLLVHSPQGREHLVATELGRHSHLQSSGLQAVLPTWVWKMGEMATVLLMNLLAANAYFY